MVYQFPSPTGELEGYLRGQLQAVIKEEPGAGKREVVTR
jgi:hypothetical protein